MKYLPADRLPSAQDFQKLVDNDPVAYNWMTLFNRREITWEECVYGIILSLADQKNAALKGMEEMYWKSAPTELLKKEDDRKV